MASGKVTAGGKLFTQTIRALNSDVKEIPPVELPYFDVTKNAYQTARSAPILLNVRAAKVVTAEDAEGREPAVAASRALEGWSAGIAHNYEDLRLIEDHSAGLDAWLKSTLRMAVLTIPPSVYLVVLLVLTGIRKRNADPRSVRARKALRRFVQSLDRRPEGATAGQAVLESLRTYLGDKLAIVSNALTFNDVGPRLRERGVEEGILEELRSVFRECEASSYAGANTVPADELRGRALTLARRLEKML
jgi:hypothetical protein